MESLLSLDLSSATPSMVLQHAVKLADVQMDAVPLEQQSMLVVVAQKIIQWLLTDRAHLRQCNKRLKMELDHALSTLGPSAVKIVKTHSPPKPSHCRSGSLPSQLRPPSPLGDKPTRIAASSPTEDSIASTDELLKPVVPDRTSDEPEAQVVDQLPANAKDTSLRNVDKTPLDDLPEVSVPEPSDSPKSVPETDDIPRHDAHWEGSRRAEGDRVKRHDEDKARLHLQKIAKGYLARRRFRNMLEAMVGGDDDDSIHLDI
ncbi:hypothetical protein Ae201684P_015191 [Aphanomyces euteiches]|nr:hypothetical protein Ae201684P_015191 [Aphanomyces euteiches]